MEITLEQFKAYIPNATLTDPEIERYLADAKRSVVRDGFEETHPEFDELQRLFALGAMQEDRVAGVRTVNGNVPDGISSIGVAGVNIGFQTPNSQSVVRNSEGKQGYFVDYSNLKRKLQFPKGRMV